MLVIDLLFSELFLSDCRNQTQCTYHDKNLYCSKSKGLRLSIQAWQILMLVLPAVINLLVMFS